MRNLLAHRPSPAMAVAFVALLAALSGTAIALPGRNTVDSGDIKRGAVKRADIGRNAVNSGKVANGSLGGADIRDDSLTGLDINESTLGQVPSANSANSASSANSANSANTANSANNAGNADRVGGASGGTIRTFNFRGTGPSAGPTEVLNLNGFTITVSCSTASGMSVIAHYNGEEALLHSESTDPVGFDGDTTSTAPDGDGPPDHAHDFSDNSANTLFVPDFGTTGTNDVELVGDNLGIVSLGQTRLSDDGVGVTVDWQSDVLVYAFSGGTYPCVFQGSAISN